MPVVTLGPRLKTVVLPAQHTSEVFFDNVIVPKTNLLGAPNKGFGYLSQFLAGERLIAAVDGVALAQTAFDLTLDYIRQRSAFRQPIGTFQNSRFIMAALRAGIYSVQTVVD